MNIALEYIILKLVINDTQVFDRCLDIEYEAKGNKILIVTQKPNNNIWDIIYLSYSPLVGHKTELIFLHSYK